MTFTNISKNVRGSGYSWRETVNNKQWYMVQRDMQDLLTIANMFNGKIYGKWKTKKKGETRSIFLLEQLGIRCDNCSYKIMCELNNKQ